MIWTQRIGSPGNRKDEESLLPISGVMLAQSGVREAEKNFWACEILGGARHDENHVGVDWHNIAAV